MGRVWHDFYAVLYGWPRPPVIQPAAAASRHYFATLRGVYKVDRRGQLAVACLKH